LDKNSIADETEGWIKADAIKELRSETIKEQDHRRGIIFFHEYFGELG
jgi:hypothetical protein